MHGIKRDKIKRQGAFWEYTIYFVALVSAFVFAGAAHDRGIAQKWVTALFGTIIPFGLVIFWRRKSLRWSFGASLAIWLAVHCVVIWYIFQYALAAFTHFSPLLWSPVVLIESFVLLIAVKRVEDKLTGRRHEAAKLSF